MCMICKLREYLDKFDDDNRPNELRIHPVTFDQLRNDVNDAIRMAFAKGKLSEIFIIDLSQFSYRGTSIYQTIDDTGWMPEPATIVDLNDFPHSKRRRVGALNRRVLGPLSQWFNSQHAGTLGLALTMLQYIVSVILMIVATGVLIKLYGP